jgi:hypothetical protein
MDSELSPQAVASFFMQAVLGSGDLRAAWAVTDEPLRRRFAVGWVTPNALHPAIARVGVERAVEELVAIDPTHFLWWHFAQDTVDRLRGTFAHVDLDTWGWTSDPRPVTIDSEIVLLVNADNAHELDSGDLACPGVEFTMRHGEDGWWIADVAVAGHPADLPAQ